MNRFSSRSSWWSFWTDLSRWETHRFRCRFLSECFFARQHMASPLLSKIDQHVLQHDKRVRMVHKIDAYCCFMFSSCFFFFTKASSTWAPEVFQTPCLSCSKLRYRIPNGFGVVRCWGWGPDSEFIPLPCALYRGGRWETVQTSTPIPIMKINSTPILTDVYGL